MNESRKSLLRLTHINTTEEEAAISTYHMCVEFHKGLTDFDLAKKGLQRKHSEILEWFPKIKNQSDYSLAIESFSEKHDLFPLDYTVISLSRLD